MLSVGDITEILSRSTRCVLADSSFGDVEYSWALDGACVAFAYYGHNVTYFHMCPSGHVPSGPDDHRECFETESFDLFSSFVSLGASVIVQYNNV